MPSVMSLPFNLILEIMNTTKDHRSTRTLLALLAWFGVLLQLWLSIRLAQANAKSIFAGLIAYFGYFTVLTNIYVALVATAPVFAKRLSVARWFAHRSVTGCATTAILLVSIAYHFLLRDIWSPQGMQWVADTVLHYIVPIAALIYWLMSSRRGSLPAWSPLVWCIYPAAYLLYALVRGELLGTYPYPFIDVTALGYAHTITNSFGLLAAYVILGYVVWGMDRVLNGRHGTH